MGEMHVYRFGPDMTDGKADMKNLLGGKGANLAEMALAIRAAEFGIPAAIGVGEPKYNSLLQASVIPESYVSSS